MCDCMEKMNAKLAALNGRLSETFGFPHDGGTSVTYPTIQVEKLNKRGKSPPLAIPTFCPFCGEKYCEPSTAAKATA